MEGRRDHLDLHGRLYTGRSAVRALMKAPTTEAFFSLGMTSPRRSLPQGRVDGGGAGVGVWGVVMGWSLRLSEVIG